MKLLVDADACPVKDIILSIAKENQCEVYMFFDTSHEYEDGYSRVFIIDKGADAVDYALISYVKKGDIVITQDYGVAAMALSKGAFPINQNGIIFTDDTIDGFLHSRYVSQKLRNSGKQLKGPRKRQKEDNDKFRFALTHLIKEAMSYESSHSNPNESPFHP